MNRKKPKSTAAREAAGSNASAAGPAAQPTAFESHRGQLRPAVPSSSIRSLLLLFAAFHLFAIFVSFTEVVEPSSIHTAISRLLQPYLVPTHFSADDRPVYLAHDEPQEQPHRLQISEVPLGEAAAQDAVPWQTVLPETSPGLAAADRRARWLATAATLAESEQPGLVADLILPVVQQQESVNAIRIVRLPTNLTDVHTDTSVPYVARVVRRGQRVSLVQLKPPRLSSTVVISAEASE